MTKNRNSKPVYDLEERTFQFAKAVRLFIKTLPKTTSNIEDGKQVIRSSGSVGANYREANTSRSKADFLNRIKICQSEVNETIYWLHLILEYQNNKNEKVKNSLEEAKELMAIFTSIISKIRFKNQ